MTNALLKQQFEKKDRGEALFSVTYFLKKKQARGFLGNARYFPLQLIVRTPFGDCSSLSHKLNKVIGLNDKSKADLSNRLSEVTFLMKMNFL